MNWYSHYHLGDCYWHCLFLRAIGGSHVFYCQEGYHKELAPILEGMDVQLRPLQNHSEAPDAIDAWIGSGQKPGRSWFAKGTPNDIIGFLLEWFEALSLEIGAPNPFKCRRDFLSNYPALFNGYSCPELDFLVVNATPTSGQCPGYITGEMDELIQRLVSGGHRVAVTNNTNVDVERIDAPLYEIGHRSTKASTIIAVATGPMWPTWNVQNKYSRRYLLLDPIRIDYGIGTPVNHAANVRELTAQLRNAALI